MMIVGFLIAILSYITFYFCRKNMICFKDCKLDYEEPVSETEDAKKSQVKPDNKYADTEDTSSNLAGHTKGSLMTLQLGNTDESSSLPRIDVKKGQGFEDVPGDKELKRVPK